MRSLFVDVTCPRCAGMLEPVAPTSPVGARHRVAGLVVECGSCGHVATVVVELRDGTHGRVRLAS